MKEESDSLIAFLPDGEVAYTREDDGTWGVAIFARGTAAQLLKVGTGMDKCVACWLAIALRKRLAER